MNASDCCAGAIGDFRLRLMLWLQMFESKRLAKVQRPENPISKRHKRWKNGFSYSWPTILKEDVWTCPDSVDSLSS